MRRKCQNVYDYMVPLENGDMTLNVENLIRFSQSQSQTLLQELRAIKERREGLDKNTF